MEKITGFVEHIVFQNTDNGYTVLELSGEEGEIILVGMMKGITQGESIDAEGDYIEHPVYGRQFKVSSYRAVTPKDAAGMERYLASGAIKGVGAALAARIVKTFGTDTFRIIEEEPIRLVEVKGISDRIAREIAAQMEEKRDLREAFLFLQQYGISNTLAVKIYNTYGDNLYRVLQENPYKMTEDIEGVGFKIADEIASRIGIHTDSDYRIRSGILYVLSQAMAEGHMYLPQELLIKRTQELLLVDEDNIRPHLQNLGMDKKLVLKKMPDEEELQVFAASAYYAELSCAGMLHDLNLSLYGEEGMLPAVETKIKGQIETITREEHLELDSLQEEAVFQCVKNGVFILSGGPGTGKTTTINTIIKYFEQEKLDIFLAAPTGRAAKRMTEATGYEARTIHRMLELSGALSGGDRKAGFERNEDNPLEADVVIIDEMSMVDILLMDALTEAVVSGTRLILVGDADQLPSVGAGNVLRDIISSEIIHTVRLTEIFRQAGESMIVVNAHRINRGEYPYCNEPDTDFFMMRRNSEASIVDTIKELCSRRLPAYYSHCDPIRDIQVLTPVRKGTLGIFHLNRELQAILNPPSPEKEEKELQNRIFRVGDKVMQIRNNYRLEWKRTDNFLDGEGIYNGDIGFVTGIDKEENKMSVVFDDVKHVEYEFRQADELELAYAMTVHKSQGSEFPVIVMPMAYFPPMLANRNLLYTGVTRGKQAVVLVGADRMMRAMIDNNRIDQRYSGLSEKLRKFLILENL